ncbi:site-specific DNA-methyltransferase [Candidatus Woesearchaeota archaeon]|nr:site-specific DNA-methyltransferase [Candidatus Woesearchaeota archaeon]
MEPYLKIDKKEWAYIKETYDRPDIQETLVEILKDYELPTQELTKKDAYKDFMKLKGIQWPDYLKESEWYARSEYKWPLTKKIIRRINRGNDASNYFQQYNRWSVDGTISPGPVRTWGNPKFMYTLLGSLFTLEVEKVDRGTLRSCIGLRKYICSQFKPNVAKSIYDMFKAETILDFSMGWGDRLAGFYASDYGKHYVGIDPRKENHSIYEEQSKFYNKHLGFFEQERKSEFHCSPAEEFDFSQYDNYFDLVFTSPPYFNVERYSYDDTQSWVRYKDIDDWNTEFLQKTLNNLWRSIKTGGYLLVNISDVNASSKGRKAKGWLPICDPMNDFLDTFKDSEYKGCVGYEMAKRPNSIGAGTAKVTEETNRKPEYILPVKEGLFAEPIWTWKKI